MSLSCTQARELDRRAIEDFGIPGIVLMDNAGRGMAELLVRRRINGRVVICCGKGNNGGDGFVIARWLDAWNLATRVVLLCMPDELTGDAATNCRIVQKCEIPLAIPPNSLEEATLRNELAGAD